MGASQKKSVFIVDDHTSWRDTLKDLLEEEYDVTTASSYKEARETLNTQEPPFHVAVVDVRLVDSDKENRTGLDLIRDELRLKGKYTNVIVCTGYGSEDTAKQAREYLDSYDYILKVPEERNGVFDHHQFREIVRKAAEDAEKKRSQKGNSILLIEKDQELRKTFAQILKTEGYQVSALATPSEFIECPLSGKHSLVLLNAAVLSEEPNLLQQIRKYEPAAKLLLTTDAQIGPIIRAIQRRDIESAITVDQHGFNIQEFRETVRNLFTAESTKYVVGQFEDTDNQNILQAEQTYTLALYLRGTPEPGSLKIWLPPKQTEITLTVILDASEMEVLPGGKIPWVVPIQAYPAPIKFQVTPAHPGKHIIVIDVDHGQFWLGGFQKEVEVCEI